MEINGLGSAFPFMFNGGEKANDAATRATGDVVDVRSPYIIPEEEVDAVYNETLNMIAQDNAGALAVHSGLSESRVFALLGY